MRASLLFILFLFTGFCFAGNFITYNICYTNGIEFKQSVEILADNCTTATNLPDGSTFDNTGNTPTVGNFDFVPEFTNPNVYYLQLDAADFPSGQDRIKVNITPTGADPIANYEVWFMGQCDGLGGNPATDITGLCFEVSPLTGINTYKIAIVSEAADAGMFNITVDVTNAPTLILDSDETSGNVNDDEIICLGDDVDFVATLDPQYSYAWEKDGNPLATITEIHAVTNASATDAGIYSVTITDNDGCTEEASLTLTVNTLPIVNLNVTENSGNTANDGEVCVDDDFTLIATAGGFSYSWTLDGNPIAGATNTLIITNATTANEGNYEVTFEDINGCFNTDDIDIDINPLPITNDTELEVCANGVGTGDFTLDDAELTPGFPNTNSNSGDDVDDGAAGMTVTYHSTLANAEAGTSPLPNSFTAANNTTIFARVESNATGCYETAQILLTVHTNPNNIDIQNVNDGNSTIDFTICEQDPINFTIDEGTGGTAPYTYDWEAPGGATFTTQNINIASSNIANHEGTWNVTVTDANGCTGTDDITVTITPNPANDDCSNSIAINTGANPGLTNECATDDNTPCTGTQNEASVWYSYDVPVGVKNLNISVNSANHFIAVYEDNCSTVLSSECDQSIDLECLEAQTVMIFVSSTTLNSGIFTVTVTETPTTAANDLCTNAQTIPNIPECEFFAVTGTTTVGACPETFTVAGCGLDYTLNEIVWYEFTTPAGTGSIEFDNITANAFLTVFEDCPASSIVPGGGCISGGTTTPITVSDNTTYYIGIGIDGAPGAVGFEIKYNLFLDNDDACGPGFIPTPIIGTLTNQDNTCATDDNDCGANPLENSLWYTFDLSAPNNVITINVTGLTSPSIAIYDAANPCNATPVDEECAGDGEKEFKCLLPGTYSIMIGTSAANAGVFSITATESQNTAVANDVCTNAIPITIGPNDLCVVLGPFDATNIDACPEDIAGAGDPCDFNTEETSWYTFTAPGLAGDQPTMDFTFTNYTGTGTPFMGVFSGADCSNLSTVEGCNSGLSTFSNLGPFTPGNTYLIGISSANDDGGDFEFEVKFNLGPPNDDPCADLSAYDISGSGSILSTTSCAGGDLIAPGCPPGDQENDVFFQFNVPVGFNGVQINIIPIGPDGYTGGVIVSVIENCTGGIAYETICEQGSIDYAFDCLAPGDYFLLVSMPSATSGDFRISYTPIADMGPTNDLCDDADVISLTECEWVDVSGTTLNACPETFNAGGCMHADDPTVFYSFTTPAGATQIDIQNIANDTYLSIITACTNGSFLACSEDGPIENLAVTENTTYWIAVSSTDPAGLNFDFEIKVAVPPVNDCTPEQVGSGGSATYTTTCCATYQGDPSQCSAANQESTVWFEYTPSPTAKAVTISFSPGSISDAIVVEGFTGAPGQDCLGALTPAADPFCIIAAPYEFVIKCEDWATTSIYVKVGSKEDFCGTFSLDFVEASGCEGPETCADVTNVMTPMTDGPATCESACNNFNCNEPGDCDPDGASVWFSFTTDAMASSAVLNVTAPFDAIMTVSFGPDCASAGNIVVCGDATETIAVQPGTTYYVNVEAAGGINLGDFSLCVVVLSAAYPCYPDSEITTITRPEYPTANPEGPYCPGEIVNFCIHIDFIVASAPAPDGNNCQWIQGIIPSLGYAWDYVGSSLDVQGPGGGWFWLDQDNVDYNVNSSIYSIGTHPDGIKYLNYLGSTTGMTAGTLLPGGWWVTSNGSGALCTNDGDPDTMWGDPFSCNGNQLYDFCLDLKVKEFEDLENCTITDLGFTLSVMADGETGCWSQISCALSEPVSFDALVDCTSNILVSGDDIEICNEGEANIEVYASEPNSTIIVNTIDNPNVTGESFTSSEGVFPNSAAIFTDNLVNTGSNVEIVQYIFYARSDNSICKGPEFTLEVTIYPELIVEFAPTYVCEGLCTDISPLVIGGNGNYVDYDWNTGANGSSLNVCPTSPTTYSVTVMDDLGCEGENEVEVDVKDPVTGEMDPDPLYACQDGVDNFGDFFTTVLIESGQEPFQFTWNPPFGVFGQVGGVTYVDDSYVIEEEASAPSGDPYVICANVIDVWGCETDICGELIIDGAADVIFTHAPLVCGQNSTVLTANFDFGNSSAGLDEFLLFDCDGNFIASENDDPSTFPIADLTTNNCFELHTITESGCITIKTLTVDPPTGIEPIVSLTSPICEGQNSFISVTNSAVYSDIGWSTNSSGASIIVKPNTTTNYSVTVTEANGCSATKVVTVVVNPIPDISIVGSLSFCTGFSTTIEANAGTGINYQWWDSNPAVVSDTSILTVSTGGLYTVSVTGAGNCTADSTITIIESTNLLISMNEPDLCDNSSDTLSPGNFFTSYLWTQDGNPSLETSSKLPINAEGIYCVTVSDGNCTGSTCVTITNSNSPVANVLIPASEVCRVPSGVGPTFVDFTTLVSGSPGTWFDDIDFVGVDLSDLTNVSFLGIARDTYQFRYITNNAIAPCVNDTAIVNIIVNNCPCPTIAFDDIVLCNDEDNLVNLNDYLIVPDIIRAGVWTVTSGPQTLNVTNDSLVSITNVIGGNYQLYWKTNSSFGSCDGDSTHTMLINDAPIANIKGDRFVCNANSPLGSTSINLDTVLISGTSAGGWLQTGGTNVTLVNNTFDANGMTPGLLEFTYTTTAATPPCDETFIVLEVEVRDCNCPLITVANDTLCNGSDNVDLNTLLTIQPTGLAGTWSTNAPGNPIAGSVFDATGVTSGSYNITFTLNVDPGGSCIDNESANIVIRRQPFTTTLSEGTPCNTNSGNGTTTVNLNTLINASSGGIWTQISGTVPLTVPVSGIVDFNGLTIGEVYEFRLDIAATAPCVPVSTTVRITIRDCDCPNVDLLTPQPICNTELTYDLTQLEGPIIGAGVWTVTDPLLGVVTVKPDKTFDINSALTGNWRLTYTLTPAPSGNCPKSNQVLLEVLKEQTAIITPSATVCNVDKGNGENILDFRNFLGANSYGGGTWVNTDNAPVNISDVSNVDFSNTTIGQSFTFTYVIDNVSPCPDRSYTIEIEIIDCTCPPIRPGDPIDVCTSDGTLDLSPLYDDPNIPGSWTSTEISINNGIANIANLASGNYTITYVVDAPIDGCPDSEDRILTVVKVKNAGTPSSADVCSNEPESIRLADLLTGEDAGGIWREVSTQLSTGNAFNANAATFNTNNQAASTYTFEYAFLNQDPCPDITQRVTVNVISAPTAQAGDPATINCTVAVAILGDPSDNQPNVTYSWTHDGGLAVPNADKATTQVNFGGEFTIVVTDIITGCKTEDDVIITVDPNKPIAQFATKDVTCFQAKDGSIGFINVTGGAAPLQYSNNGGTTFQASPNFTNLNGGTYEMVIKDATGCIFKETIVIDEPALLTIDLGSDITITKGESDTLSLIGQLPSNITTIQWTSTDSSGVNILCQLPPEECFEIVYKPEISTTICATVIDENGCEAEDCKVINLLKARNIIFSNMLNGDDSGENNYFYPESADVAWVNKMRVYDRWGNLMFTRDDFAANNQALGWNGKFNGKDVVPGVYTWVVEVEYEVKGSGDVEVFVGDVTVIR